MTKQLLNKTLSRLIPGLIALFTLLGFSNAQAQFVSVNTNGSFELSDVTVSGDTASVLGWNFFVLDDGAAGTYAIVDSVAKDGTKSLAISPTATGDEDYSLGAVNEGIPVGSGISYTVTLWAKASEDGATANFTVHNPSNGYNELGRVDNANVNLTTEWQEFSFEFISPLSGDTLRAPMHFSFPANIGKTIYLDSVRVTGPNTQPVIVEAESGTLGEFFADSTEGSTTFITTLSNTIEFVPDSSARVASYEVAFPGPGGYELFARVRAGAGAFDDDSFFFGTSFGELHPDSASDWSLVNGMAAAGFSNPTDVVRAAGGAGAEVWKWVNLSRNVYGGTAVTFTIEEGDDLTQTFQIGSREDGLDIDKFAFGDSSIFFTVENLDNNEPGSITDPTDTGETFSPIAEGKVKYLGNVYSSAQTSQFEQYWNQVTPENGGKWGSVEGTRDQMNWGGLDNAYNLARDNGFPFRFHVLIWGGQQPGWINDLEPAEQLEEIEEWFAAVAERYPDLELIEVVNEGSNGHQLPDGISGDANYIDALGGTGETGFDWIITSFELARQYFPDADLMINDYGIVSSVNATTNYKAIIDELNARGLIDAIGVQSHAFSINGISDIDLRRNLNSLASTGLPIIATEFDLDGIPDADPSVTTPESDQRQLERYQRVFPQYWEHPGVVGVTLWGWRPGLWRNDEEAYLISNSNVERPALEWLRAYVDTAQVEINLVNNEEFGGEDIPGKFSLEQNYPNPFNPSTNISYQIPAASQVAINVYDITGRLVQTLVNTRQSAGSYTISFDAATLSTGVYFYEIRAGQFRDIKKMTLIK